MAGGWVGGWVCAWLGGWLGGWVDGWLDGGMDRLRMHACRCSIYPICSFYSDLGLYKLTTQSRFPAMLLTPPDKYAA